MTGWFKTRKHGSIGRHKAVEIVKDAVAFDQHLAAVQDQRRNSRERVVTSYLIGIAEGRPGAMLEGKVIECQSDADPAHERGVILANKNHPGPASVPELRSQGDVLLQQCQRDTKRAAS